VVLKALLKRKSRLKNGDIDMKSCEDLIAATVAVKGIFRRFAELSETDRDKVETAVRRRIVAGLRADGYIEGMSSRVARRFLAEEISGEPAEAEPAEDPPEDSEGEEESDDGFTPWDSKADFPGGSGDEEAFAALESGKGESGEEGAAESGDLTGMVDGLTKEVDQVKSDGKVDPAEALGILDSMMKMVTMLVDAKPPAKKRAPRKTAAEFATKKELAQYLKDHPRADKSKHKVVPGGGKGKKKPVMKKAPVKKAPVKKPVVKAPAKPKAPAGAKGKDLASYATGFIEQGGIEDEYDASEVEDLAYELMESGKNIKEVMKALGAAMDEGAFENMMELFNEDYEPDEEPEEDDEGFDESDESNLDIVLENFAEDSAAWEMIEDLDLVDAYFENKSFDDVAAFVDKTTAALEESGDAEHYPGAAEGLKELKDKVTGLKEKSEPGIKVDRDVMKSYKQEVPEYKLELMAGKDGVLDKADVENAKNIKEKLKWLGDRIKKGITEAADICDMNPPVCAENMGITRDHMPQVMDKSVKDLLNSEDPKDRKKGEAAVAAGADPNDDRPVLQQLMDDVETEGVKIDKGKVPVGQLRATQSEILADKTYGIASSYLEGNEGLLKAMEKPIIITSDNHILDGHHRYSAMLTADPAHEMSVIRIDMPMKDFLMRAHQQPGVFRADIKDKIIPDDQPVDLGGGPQSIERKQKIWTKDEWAEYKKAHPGTTIKPKFASDMASRVAADFLASRGNQTNRKDKDTMSDTGGASKGRDREPDGKPPRDDVKRRHREKRKTTENKDKDVDLDPDRKAAIAGRVARRLWHELST
jgi:hypothetical protein